MICTRELEHASRDYLGNLGQSPFKGTVSLGNKLFLNSTHLLDINYCANNNCSKVFILKKSKIHGRRHFVRIDMGWRPLTHVCLLASASFR